MALSTLGVQTGTGLVNVGISGLDQIEHNLKMLREEFGVKTGGVINRGLMAGARLIRDEAKRNAPVLDSESARKAFKARAKHRAGYHLASVENQRVPGNIKHNIVAHYVKKQPLTVWVRVRTKTWIFATRGSRRGILGGADPSNLIGNPNYWWLQEFGYKGRPGKAFMRKAFESKKIWAGRLAAETMAKEIEKLGAKFGVQARLTV